MPQRVRDIWSFDILSKERFWRHCGCHETPYPVQEVFKRTFYRISGVLKQDWISSGLKKQTTKLREGNKFHSSVNEIVNLSLSRWSVLGSSAARHSRVGPRAYFSFFIA